jgi:carbamoyltransferase
MSEFGGLPSENLKSVKHTLPRKHQMNSNRKPSSAVLGVYLGHDLGACLLMNGEIIAMIEEERLNRFKHGRPNEAAGLWKRFAGKFGYFPWASISYCLEAGKLGLDDLDFMVIGGALWGTEAAGTTIKTIIPIKDTGKIILAKEPKSGVHHYLHALSAFLASPYDEAAVLVVDGEGSRNEQGYEAETGFHFLNRDGDYKEIFKNRYPDSVGPRSGIGWVYEQLTILLGFADPRVSGGEAGKTMGLASYGKPRKEFELPWICHNGFDLDYSGFHKWLKESGYASRLRSFEGGLAGRGDDVSQYAKDLAFKVQSELEAAMLHLTDELHRATGLDNLCLAGGVALNSVANSAIAAKGPFKNIFIQPAANDGGQAIGLAFYGHLLLARARRQCVEAKNDAAESHASRKTNFVSSPEIRPIKHAYGGRNYSAEEIRHLLQSSGLAFREFADDQSLVQDAAAELTERRIIGWLQGGSEYGPRALGHRSILANPDTQEMKDILNLRVKFREPFRPFAPSVLIERAGGVFDLDCESPYMLLVAPVRESWRERVPAITHVDGTARVQTVDSQVEPLFHSLISAFESKTGLPLILNTSFNWQGAPIVESPYDALQCLLYTDLDCLYLGPFKLRRPDPSHWFPIRSFGWEFFAGHYLSNGRRELICKQRGGAKQVVIETTNRFTDLCEALNGTNSMQSAFNHAYGPDADGNLIEETIRLVQKLCRHGALRIRAGRLFFGTEESKFGA